MGWRRRHQEPFSSHDPFRQHILIPHQSHIMTSSKTGTQLPSNGTKSPPKSHFQRVTSQPENPFANLIPDQSIAIVPSFTLESGVELQNVPVAYKTYGRLSPAADNAMVICHALTGSADVGDW